MKAQLIPGDKRIATVVTALVLFLVLSCAPGHTLEIPDYNTSIQVTAGNRTGIFSTVAGISSVRIVSWTGSTILAGGR